MVTIFGTLNTALRGMRTQLKALETAGHNIANANTPGYSRQQVVMRPTPAYPLPSINRPGGAGQVGTGVEIESIKRVRDSFVDSQIRQETITLGYWSSRDQILRQIEGIYNEPSDTGINTLMGQFWDGWQELSKYPESSPVRTTVVETATSLAESFRHTYQQLERMRLDLTEQAQIKVEEINSLARQLADLNQQIVAVRGSGQEPNDLLDHRDLLLDQLAQVVDFTVYEGPLGNVTVSVGQRSLIQGETIEELEMQAVDGTMQVVWQRDGEEVATQGGELTGILTMRDDLIVSYQNDMDLLASGLIDTVNTLHHQGVDLNGDIGEDFFIGSNAGDIRVDTAIVGDVNKIAAALQQDEEVVFAGNGTNALAIAQLRSARLGVEEGTLIVVEQGGATFGDYYKNFISTLGVVAHESQRMVTNQQVLVQQLQNRRESISGVSLDEEMTALIQFQRAYQAAARVISTMDELVDTLVNRMAR